VSGRGAAELVRRSGTQFDPAGVDALLGDLGVVPADERRAA
jgi:hypothetical protein